MEASASLISRTWPRGHHPFPRKERAVSSLPNGASTPSQGLVGEGGGSEDADKIKGMKWKVSCAFLRVGPRPPLPAHWASLGSGRGGRVELQHSQEQGKL